MDEGCLLYGICRKHIGNAKRIQQKLNWSDLTEPSNSRKYRLTIKNTDARPYSLSSTYISLNCSARLSQINLIFATFFSYCQYASDKYHKPNILWKKYFHFKGEAKIFKWLSPKLNHQKKMFSVFFPLVYV